MHQIKINKNKKRWEANATKQQDSLLFASLCAM